MSISFASKILFVSCLGLSTLAIADTLEQAVSALKAGQTEQAVDLFKQQKSNPEAMFYLAKIFMDSDLDEAEEWIEKTLKKQPENAEAHYFLGRIMGGQAQNSIFSALSYAGKSVDAFTRAVELMPDSVRYRNALMQFHIQAPSIAGGDIEIAKQQVVEIQQLDAIAGLKAEIDFASSQDDNKSVEQLLAEAKQTYTDIPDFFFKAGMIYQRQENYERAIAELAQAVTKTALTEDSIKAKYNALYQLGKTAVLSGNSIESGIQSLNEYIAQAPNFDGMPPRSWAEFRLANLLVLNSQQPEAKSIYLRLAKNDDKELVKQAKKASKKI